MRKCRRVILQSPWGRHFILPSFSLSFQTSPSFMAVSRMSCRIGSDKCVFINLFFLVRQAT